MQFECSYIMTYDEASDSEELRMRIDAVSVIPKESQSVESICSVDGDHMGQVRFISSLIFMLWAVRPMVLTSHSVLRW